MIVSICLLVYLNELKINLSIRLMFTVKIKESSYWSIIYFNFKVQIANQIKSNQVFFIYFCLAFFLFYMQE